MSFPGDSVSQQSPDRRRMESSNFTASRVLIVDDQKITRQGLRMLLEGKDGVQVVGDTNGVGAIEMALACRPDVIIIDFDIPDVTIGIGRLSRLRETVPDARVIIFASDENQPDLIHRAIHRGAVGYLSKNHSDIDEVATAIRTVARGEVFVSSAALSSLVQFIRDEKQRRPTSAATLVDRLTARESDVLNLVAQGFTNRQIANRLVISESTARSHLHNILDKLQMTNRVQAAAYALRVREPVS